MKLSIRFAYFTILALAIISFKPGWSKATDIDSDAAGLKGEVTEPKSAEGGDVDNVAIYVAKLGTLDHISSTGVVLKSAAAIILQDRANYHRFKKRDPEDQGDKIFLDKKTRSLIPSAIARSCCPFNAIEEATIVNGTPTVKVWVSWDGQKYFMTVQILSR